MRAIPSPTSSTVPTSRASMPVVTFLICSLITETISSTLNAMAAPLHQLTPHGLDARADAGVVDPVVYPDDQAPEDVGIDGLVQDRLPVAQRPDVVDQPLPLLVVQRHGGADMHGEL